MRGLRSGFTLVELMVTTAIMGLVTIYVLSALTTQRKSYAVTDQVVDIQQNLRLLGDVIERDIRHAGLMVPQSAAVCGLDSNAAPDSLYLSDADAIDPLGENRSDLGARISGLVNVANGLQTVTVDRQTLEIQNPRPAYDNDGDGVNDTDFQVGNAVIVTDAANPRRGAACGLLRAIPNATQLQLNIVTGPLDAVQPGDDAPDLVVVPAHEYRVDATMQLLRDGVPVAADTEDLQVAYFFDLNGDNLVDPGEYEGDGAGADYVANAVDGSEVRELRVNIVLRTRDPDLDNPNGLFQATENRAPVVVNDGFRRRVYTTTVMLRNVGNRV